MTRPLCLLVCVLVTCPVAADEGPLPCRHEDGLARVAALMLLEERDVTPAGLSRAAHEAGLGGSALHARQGGGRAGTLRWLQELTARADGSLVCGEAQAEGRRLVLASVLGGRLWRAGERVQGALEPGFEDPVLVVAYRRGLPERRSVSAAQLQTGIALGAEVVRVQLVAEGALGPRPVAELSLTAGAPATPERSYPAAQQAPDLFYRLARFRRQAGVLPLRPNALLRTAAARHARRVCDAKQVAHRVAGGPGPEARLRRARVKAQAVGEAVARADDVSSAFAAILDSPSHRLTLGTGQYTDVGIGFADDVNRACVVVMLARWPQRI